MVKKKINLIAAVLIAGQTLVSAPDRERGFRSVAFCGGCFEWLGRAAESLPMPTATPVPLEQKRFVRRISGEIVGHPYPNSNGRLEVQDGKYNVYYDPNKVGPNNNGISTKSPTKAELAQAGPDVQLVTKSAAEALMARIHQGPHPHLFDLILGAPGFGKPIGRSSPGILLTGFHTISNSPTYLSPTENPREIIFCDMLSASIEDMDRRIMITLSHDENTTSLALAKIRGGDIKRLCFRMLDHESNKITRLQNVFNQLLGEQRATEGGRYIWLVHNPDSQQIASRFAMALLDIHDLLP